MGGTMNTLFATYDVWEDCVTRRRERSDAMQYAELLHSQVPCLPFAPRRIGAVWFLVSLCLGAGSLYIALQCMPHGPHVRGYSDLSRFSRDIITVLLVVLLVAMAFRLWCS